MHFFSVLAPCMSPQIQIQYKLYYKNILCNLLFMYIHSSFIRYVMEIEEYKCRLTCLCISILSP